MDKRKKIEEEVKKTMECFDQVKPIDPNPYFFTRLETEIESREKQQKLSGFKVFDFGVLRPAFLALIIAANIISAVFLFQNTDYLTDDKQRYLAAFAEEYSLNQNDSDYFSNYDED